MEIKDKLVEILRYIEENKVISDKELDEELYKREIPGKVREILNKPIPFKDKLEKIVLDKGNELDNNLITGGKYIHKVSLLNSTYKELNLEELEENIKLLKEDRKNLEKYFDFFAKRGFKIYGFVAFFPFVFYPNIYLPIGAAGKIEKGLKYFDLDMKLNKRCSYDNYMEFLSKMYLLKEAIEESDSYLSKRIEKDTINLLLAHDVVYILGHKKNEKVTQKDIVNNIKKTIKKEKIFIPDPEFGRRGEEEVLKHLIEKGFNAIDVSRENLGWDIEVIRDGKKEFIEVKSTKGDGKAFILTRKEFKKMREKGEKYYLYIHSNF